MAKVNADNKLLNYVLKEREEAKASSGGFNFGDYIAEAANYGSMSPFGLVAGLTKPLWEKALSDEANEKLDNFVDAATFIPRNVREGLFKSIEGIHDFGAQAQTLVPSLLFPKFRESVKEYVEKDHVGEWYDREPYKHREDAVFKEGGFIEGAAQGVGGMLPSVLLAVGTGGTGAVAQGASKLPQILSLATTATGAAGNATESAYKDGAGYYGGLAYGAAIGGLEAATEKLVGGGLDKVFGGGFLDDILPSVGQWAKTGIGRYAANAAGEGVEEMVSEFADPLAKIIYKGKDALSDYKDLEYWKGVGKAGLMGAAISGIYGGAFDAMGGGVKAGDIDSLLKDADAAASKAQNMQNDDRLDKTTEAKLKSQTLGDFKAIENILKNLPESKRAEIIESRQLSDMFEADGEIKVDFMKVLDGSEDLLYNKKYYSVSARGSEQKIADGLAGMREELVAKYAKENKVGTDEAEEAVGELKLFDSQLTEDGNNAFTKFKKALSYLNKKGNCDVKFAVVEPNSAFNGAKKGDVLYIGADTFENGKWAGTLVHEYMHFEEGTAEYDALVKHLASDERLFEAALDEIAAKNYGFDVGKLKAIADKRKSGEGISAEERNYYANFHSEVSAHMGEMLLGSESFIDNLVARDGNLAQKAVAKIKSLKAMFERLGNAEASAEYKFLKRAENLYLKAAEKAGDARLIRYITSGEWDEEEAEFARKTTYRFEYGKINGLNMSQRQITAFSRELADKTKNMNVGEIRWLYISDHKNGYYVLADGYLSCDIVKIFNTIGEYKKAKNIVEVYRDANRDTEVFNSWSNVVPFERRGGNDDSVMSGRGGGSESDDRIPFGSQRGNEGRDIGSLQEDYDEQLKRMISEVVEEGTDGFVRDDDTTRNYNMSNKRKVVKFALKSNEDNRKPTSYTKAEAEEMVSGILTEFFSAPDYAGKIKNMSDAVKMAMATLNGAEAGKRLGPAQKLADYIIAHTVLKDTVDEWRLEPFARRLEQLKPYLHSLNLDSIEADIKYHYDKDRSPFARWAVKKGERGLGIDVMAQELEADGFPLFATNIADMFIEIDREYLAAREAFKKNADMAVKEAYSAEELKALRQKIAQEIMRHYDDRDASFSSMMNTVKSATAEVERLRAANTQLKKEAYKATKSAERAIAKKNEAEERARKADEARRENEGFSQAANRVLKLVREVKNWKSGVFESAAEANGDVLKGIVGKLSGIEIKGNISATATRKIMRELAGWYGAADMYPIVKELKDADMWDEGALEAMKAIGDDKKIDSNAKLTKAELGLTESVIRHLKQVVESYHRVFRAGKYIDAKPLAKDYIRIIGENAKIRVGRVAKLIDGSYYENFGDVESLMKWHDRYDKGGFLTATFNELREGALNMAIAQMEMRAELDDFLDKNGKFLSRITNEKIEVEGLEMTRAEAISLYMTARREHAEGGIAIGGFEVVDTKTGEKHGVDGLVETEYKESGEVDLEKLQGLVGKLQRTLYAQFTDTEKRYIAIVERILNDCKGRKTKTDNIRLGYSNTIEGYYYPIRRGHLAQKIGEDTLGAELGRIRSLSFNQNTVHGAKGRLLIEPVNNVIDRHIAGIAKYENLSIAIDNFNRLYNLDISGNRAHPQTIATALAGEGGWAEAGKYIDKLIKDIEGIKSVDKWESKALGFIRSGFVKFQLGANPKTWVTQLSSLLASMSVLDPKYVGIAMKSNTGGKAFADELDEYSALAKLRNSENTAALSQGVVDKLGKVGDFLMKPIGATDRFVIKKLWYACQLQVEAEQKLKFGTEENKVTAAKLLEKVIFETQQNSLLTERSAAMRSSSELMKGFTMFSSDAMKMTARIVDAYGRVCVIKEKLKGAEGDVKKSLEAELKEATGEFKRASGSAVAVAVFMSLIALAFSHLYGKRDDDETFGEKAVTFGADFAGNLLGGLPLIRDVYSYIADGYELNHYAVSSVNDLLSGVSGLFSLVDSWVTGKQITQREVASKTKAALFGVGQLFGIPLRNAYNVGRGLTGGISLITGNGKSFGYAWDSFFYDKGYKSDLNKAIEAGDDKLVARISALMVGESFDGVGKPVADEMRRLVGAGADVMPRAVGDSITYDGEEYAFTLRQRKRFDDIYGTADEVLADLVKLKQYKTADDEVKAKAVKFIYETYYDLAVDDMLGVDSAGKNVLFAEAIDIEKLAIIVAQARAFTADKDKNGKAISGTKKLKVTKYIEQLSLTAAEKYMIYGYLGYRNTYGEDKVKAYINRLKLTSAEKKALLEFSGYKAA